MKDGVQNDLEYSEKGAESLKSCKTKSSSLCLSAAAFTPPANTAEDIMTKAGRIDRLLCGNDVRLCSIHLPQSLALQNLCIKTILFSIKKVKEIVNYKCK